MLRILIAHPHLALALDEEAMTCFDHFGEESADSLRHLVEAAQSLGEGGTFAALSQQLREVTTEYDRIIAEIAAEPEDEVDGNRIVLLSAIRQIKMDSLKHELNQLFSSGLTPDQVSTRYREIVAQQDILAREDAAARVPQ